MTDRAYGREASRPRPITSLQNDRIKAVRALDMRKARRETGLFVAEGASILVTARQAGFKVRTLIYEPQEASGSVARDLIKSALADHAEVLEVSSAVLAKVSSKDNPQAMLGVFDQRWGVAPDANTQNADDLWLVLEEVRDPGNLGTMIRTVDAVGGRGIILVGNCCDPYSRECVRATMGSIFSTPLVKMQREEFLAWRVQWPGDVVGLHLRASDDFRNVAYRGPVMVVMGSEGPGLSAELTEACSRRVKIPMAGKLDSLNLAIATALTLYQIRGPHLSI
ncbi:RNA methyltransferase [Candidatus Filomicrobium marinum]|uniref:RNA methyltransferase n=2 Tax=Filomicrobium TaxID=119044 RepID=A0A0D6JA56_9HYPH|nr:MULTISPECIES: RNA methyltransferase [Filomicrobium]MCV0368870.1 RNA methyltransferase [Filomicrobium sp.]CFW97559.1 RNA methyltransferase [Candidatus Filomicrobium marinum]CPR14701.1 RNA methyltransferase [Candidatus Filomicrobium marinum]SDO76852.1 RNA methyltransferase, TrmH family [Filomicrobium insigne]